MRDESNVEDMSDALLHSSDVSSFLRSAALKCTHEADAAQQTAEREAIKAVRKSKMARHLGVMASTYEEIQEDERLRVLQKQQQQQQQQRRSAKRSE